MNTFLNFMKRNYKILVAVLALSLALWSFMPKQKGDPEKDKLLLELLTFVIEKVITVQQRLTIHFQKEFIKNF